MSWEKNSLWHSMVVFEGKEVPEKCPVCKHPRAYFEVLAENY
jgi:rubrerythrin